MSTQEATMPEPFMSDPFMSDPLMSDQNITELTTLADWLAYISKAHPAEIEMGLGRIRQVFNLMGLAECAELVQPKQIVVVSGTNGKGSTIALIEAGLLSMGLTVGAYTSPHIQSYNERVKINAKPVSDEKLIAAFSLVEQARKDTTLTYFEFGTLAAFDVLFTAELDVLILEIGLGGRLDAVNIIDADLAIITSVGLDHTDWLGTSLEAIGFEKAGILRPKGQAILGENLPASVYQYAEEIACQSLLINEDFSRHDQNLVLSSHTEKLKFSGFPTIRLPDNNILLALQAIQSISENLVAKSLKSTKTEFCYPALLEVFSNLVIPGRLEEIKSAKLSSTHRVFLDVGHNPHAARYLVTFLAQFKVKGGIINAVYSSLADKDVVAVSEILSPVFDTWFIAPLEDERALDITELETAVGVHAKNMLSFLSLHEALDAALTARLDHNSTQSPSITLVFGSFYVIEAAKAYFEGL